MKIYKSTELVGKYFYKEKIDEVLIKDCCFRITSAFIVILNDLFGKVGDFE